MIQVVIGVLERPRSSIDIEYLVGRRSGRAYTGCCEFPGGKVEPGETQEDALMREWAEELGVRVRVGAKLFEQNLTTADLVDFQAIAYRVSLQAGEHIHSPPYAVHDRIEWMTRAEIMALPDDVCTPSLKLIVQRLPLSIAEARLRASACLDAVRIRRGGIDLPDAELEREALLLMPPGKLEAALTPE